MSGDQHRQGVPMSEELAEELHKPVRKHFKKRRVISKHVDDIWTCFLILTKSGPFLNCLLCEGRLKYRRTYFFMVNLKD